MAQILRPTTWPNLTSETLDYVVDCTETFFGNKKY